MSKILIVYDSLTGNVERFVSKMSNNFRKVKIKKGLIVEESFILITYTFNFGDIPKRTQQFLKENSKYLKGVVSSGNKNWGKNYALAANKISDEFNVPLLHKFEMSGTKNDVDKVNMEVDKIDNKISKMD